ncbi:hypothetical protein ACQRDF_02580 [Lachnospiraceae bacterium SGI.054]
MADKEKMFNTYPLKDTIAKNDVGMLWNTSTSEVNNFTMENLTLLMIEAMKNNMTVDKDGILHL